MSWKSMRPTYSSPSLVTYSVFERVSDMPSMHPRERLALVARFGTSRLMTSSTRSALSTFSSRPWKMSTPRRRSLSV